jgi:hypothetical protein
MDEDLKALMAALDRVAFSDARIRNLASRRRSGQFPAWSPRSAVTDPANHTRQPEEVGA